MKKYKFTTILKKAKIGSGTKVGNYCEINGKIGKNCSIQAFVFIPEGVTLEDHIFVGPHVCFTNDLYPPSYGKYWKKTLVKEGAAIGANSSILAGITIGKESLIGMGSVVLCDVPDGETWVGSPAHKI